jgi:hypothetical protein
MGIISVARMVGPATSGIRQRFINASSPAGSAAAIPFLRRENHLNNQEQDNPPE